MKICYLLYKGMYLDRAVSVFLPTFYFFIGEPLHEFAGNFK